jgi:hypothetical protein
MFSYIERTPGRSAVRPEIFYAQTSLRAQTIKSTPPQDAARRLQRRG